LKVPHVLGLKYTEKGWIYKKLLIEREGLLWIFTQ